MAYEKLEPFGDRRGDWHAASICAAIANAIMISAHNEKRFQISDFLLEWKETAPIVSTGTGATAPTASGLKPPTRRPWQHLKAIAQMCAIAMTEPPRKPRVKPGGPAPPPGEMPRRRKKSQ